MVTHDPVGTFLSGAIAGVGLMLALTLVLGVGIRLCARRARRRDARALSAVYGRAALSRADARRPATQPETH